MNICEVLRPGKLDYATSVILQESYVKTVQQGASNEVFILLEHPHVITMGRGFHLENLLLSPDLLAKHGISVEETARGGDVTYHGPGQRVAYVMLDLKARGGDVRRFVRDLEEWIIRTLARFNVRGERREGRVGIWVAHDGREDKIAAIGVRVRRWVTYHGIAINVDPDLSHFSGIVPCGIAEYGVTSMARLGVPVAQQAFDEALERRVGEFLAALVPSEVE